MASRRSSDIEGALKRKGFRLDETHHRYLVLHVDGKRTAIRTRLSHSGMDYGDDLLSQVRKQLQLPSKRELLSLIDCPLSEQDYLSMLRANGKLEG